jgi:hypothetical protein
MPYLEKQKIKDLVEFIQSGIPAEKYQEIVGMFAQLAQESLQGEDHEQQLKITAKFIEDAKAVRSAMVMKPILAVGYAVNNTREGERKELLATILKCGSAIWGSGLLGKSDPEELLNLLTNLIATQKRIKP